jgi:hypothetical protein
MRDERTSIILTRFKAHANYISPRIYSKKKRAEFDRVCASIIKQAESNGEPYLESDRHGGVNLAVDVMEDIIKTTLERFGDDGRTGDFYMEKL